MRIKHLAGASIAIATMLMFAPAAGASGLTEWIASGSASPQPATPSRPVVSLGDYCEAFSEPAMTSNGGTAYCVRVQFTDAYVWSDSTELVATDPHFPVNPGDRCLDANAVTVGTEQRVLYCNPTENGRNRGALVWQLQP